MGQFIEERLDACIQLGAETSDSYFVDVSNTVDGSRYASLQNGLPARAFDIGYVLGNDELTASVESLFHRTYGGFAGFRVKAWRDYTTALDGKSAPTALDCTLNLVSAGVYQLVKEYGRDKPGLATIGRPRRLLRKPVTGTTLIGVAGAVYPAAQWSVNTTTGLVTLAANKTGTITAISKASSAVITVANSMAVGESVVITGVVGMTQINGIRALITARTASSITVAINSALFSDYVSGGAVNTRPQPGEAVTGGCEFDIPVAFDSSFNVSALGAGVYDASGLRLVELLNP